MWVGAGDEARAELLRFYRDDPEGLYRGEALKKLGDLYLEAKWDPRNAGEDWDAAFEYFDRALQLDPVLKSAETGSFFNTYDRLRRSRLQQALIATPEEMRGLHGKAKLAMQWADMQFLMADFTSARSLYQRLQAGAEKHRDGNVLTRAALGEALLLGASSHPDRMNVLTVFDDIVERFPRTACAPYILFQCALFAPINEKYGTPPTAADYFRMIYTRYPGSRMAIRARREEIVRCVHGSEHEKRREMIEEFAKDYPKSSELESLQKLDERILTFYEENRELVERANAGM